MLLYSLIFGLIAWALAVIAIIKPQKSSMLIFGSFLSCSISAVWQFFEIQKRVFAHDYAGIEDTIGSTIAGVIIMMGITLVLNFLALRAKNR